jgi:hypothetical protein
MNSLFVDEVTKAKSQVTGSMPADRAVARVNALDWQEIGDRTLSGQTGFPVIRAKLNSSALFGHCVLYSGYRVFKNATRSSLSWSDRCRLKRVS